MGQAGCDAIAPPSRYARSHRGPRRIARPRPRAWLYAPPGDHYFCLISLQRPPIKMLWGRPTENLRMSTHSTVAPKQEIKSEAANRWPTLKRGWWRLGWHTAQEARNPRHDRQRYEGSDGLGELCGNPGQGKVGGVRVLEHGLDHRCCVWDPLQKMNNLLRGHTNPAFRLAGHYTRLKAVDG
jgi:hypothetical protein